MHLIRQFLNRKLARKVPEITFLFWIIKLLTTAMGESTSDFMVHHIDPVIAVLIGFSAFVIALVLQFMVQRYIPWVYWLSVTMVAVFGTMAADVLHIVIGVPYLISTICFLVALIIVFIMWYKIEKTLSIHSISTPRREIFYWLAIITTFALGTAAGDMSAVTLQLGYLASGIVFAVLFIIPLISYRYFKYNEALTFWIAYIFTRPLGASFADWFGRTPNLGGIGFGTGRTSLVLTILIVLFVIYLTIIHIDIKKNREKI